MAKKNKKTPTASQSGIDKKQLLEEREQLILSLIQKTDEKANDKFTDEKLDRKNEIFELLGGSTINLGEERAKWLAYFANALQEYSRVFPESIIWKSIG